MCVPDLVPFSWGLFLFSENHLAKRDKERTTARRRNAPLGVKVKSAINTVKHGVLPLEKIQVLLGVLAFHPLLDKHNAQDMGIGVVSQIIHT